MVIMVTVMVLVINLSIITTTIIIIIDLLIIQVEGIPEQPIVKHLTEEVLILNVLET